MQTILAFFELWSFGFWLLAALAVVLFTVAAEKETHFLALVTAVVLSLIYWKQVHVDVTSLLIGIGLYALVGAIWSLYRWAKHVKEAVAYAKLHDNKISANDYILTPRHQKSKIVAWILYWPFSAGWNLVEDFVVKIYESLTQVYDKITKKILASSGLK